VRARVFIPTPSLLASSGKPRPYEQFDHLRLLGSEPVQASQASTALSSACSGSLTKSTAVERGSQAEVVSQAVSTQGYGVWPRSVQQQGPPAPGRGVARANDSATSLPARPLVGALATSFPDTGQTIGCAEHVRGTAIGEQDPSITSSNTTPSRSCAKPQGTRQHRGSKSRRSSNRAPEIGTNRSGRRLIPLVQAVSGRTVCSVDCDGLRVFA